MEGWKRVAEMMRAVAYVESVAGEQFTGQVVRAVEKLNTPRGACVRNVMKVAFVDVVVYVRRELGGETPPPNILLALLHKASLNRVMQLYAEAFKAFN